MFMLLSSTENILNLPSPLERLQGGIFERHDVFIKRDDLIHPFISGNKWRKLQNTIDNFDKNEYKGLVTFGGAFSNHIVATAVACYIAGIKSVAYIRTDSIDHNNPTLQVCKMYKMGLEAMDRTSYKNKSDNLVLDRIVQEYPKYLIVPEGGSNRGSVQGLQEMMTEIDLQEEIMDFFVSSYGTGATGLGILNTLSAQQKLLIFPAIKGLGRSRLMEDGKNLGLSPKSNFEILYRDSQKKYAQYDEKVFNFAEEFYLERGILLDPIYTAGAMMGLIDYMGSIESRSRFCFIHTGGIQAWRGYFYRFPNLQAKIPNIYSAVE